MFTTRRRFGNVPCPLRDSCNRPICLFSHNFTPVPTQSLVYNVPEPAVAKAVPAKRPAQSDAPLTPRQVPSSSRPSYPENAERPTKFQKTGSAARPVALPTASSSPVSERRPMLYCSPLIGILDWSSYPYDQCWAVKDTRFDAPGMSFASCPSSRSVLSAPPARALISFISLSLLCMLTLWLLHLFTHIKNMLKSIYDHFVVLYNAVLPQNPSLASEHALRQEQEIYERTTKSTYRNVIISVLF